MSSNFH